MGKTSSNTNIENIGDTAINPAQEDGNLQKLIGFEIPPYDTIELTYVSAGDGVGEIETVTYKKSGSQVANLTLSYNSDDKISSISKS